MAEATIYGAGSDVTEAIGPRIAAIPASSRGETILANGYHELGSGDGFGATAWLTCIVGGHCGRIRKSGAVTGVKLYVRAADAHMSSLKFVVFRNVRSGNTFWKVGESEAIAWGNLSASSVNTIEFSSPITDVKAGDFIGYALQCDGVRTDLVTAYDGAGQSPALDADDWSMHWDASNFSPTESSPAAFGNTTDIYSFRLQSLTDSPVVMLIGDSIASGSPGGAAAGGRGFLSNIGAGIDWYDIDPLANIGGYLYGIDSTLFDMMNHGYGSSDSADWASSGSDYVTTHCTDYHPRAAIITLGLNDIADSATYSTFEANLADIIQSLRSNSVIPVMLTITPYHDGDAGQKDSVRTWNKFIKRWCARRGVLCVDANRAIADASDPDSISASAPDLHSTGVHPNSAGYRAIAAAIAPHVIAQR